MQNLDRFIKAQEQDYPVALQEIKSGHKQSHWIWYIFPQMKGLGKSGMSETYAIQNREHAYAYMNNITLCVNYRCCCQAILDSGKTVYEIFGDDAENVRSSILLMDSVWNDEVIKEVIKKHGWK